MEDLIRKTANPRCITRGRRTWWDVPEVSGNVLKPKLLRSYLKTNQKFRSFGFIQLKLIITYNTNNAKNDRAARRKNRRLSRIQNLGDVTHHFHPNLFLFLLNHSHHCHSAHCTTHTNSNNNNKNATGLACLFINCRCTLYGMDGWWGRSNEFPEIKRVLLKDHLSIFVVSVRTQRRVFIKRMTQLMWNSE